MLGCIADDVTGATDLATNLVQGGMSVVQWLGIPTADEVRAHPAEGVIIALKSRSIAAEEAISQSLQALTILKDVGCQRYFFKYCSTFDSTPSGNIGPVATALYQALGVKQTVYVPAFPRNGRTVCRGYLFVGDVLLNESGMEHHPLNPMTDANLIRTLQQQVAEPVGLLNYATIDAGPTEISLRLQALRAAGVTHVMVDTLNDRHLEVLASAFGKLLLITGGSGIARFLPSSYRKLNLLPTSAVRGFELNRAGRRAILSGSCSAATQRQVAIARPHCACFQIDPAVVAQTPDRELQRFRQWLTSTDTARPVLIYSTSDAKQVADLQTQFGRERTAAALEEFQSTVARTLVTESGVRVLVVAGGETSGAVVKALDIRGLEIGPEICPGVPWTRPLGHPDVALALKSGNFGDDDFFLTALEPNRAANV